MAGYGGFEHNRQSLRVVDELEERFADFHGLNLTYETREGILKHCAPSEAHELGELGRRFREGTQPSLEAQLTNLADEIAYNAHDIDDGLRSGLIDEQHLDEVALFADTWSASQTPNVWGGVPDVVGCIRLDQRWRLRRRGQPSRSEEVGSGTAALLDDAGRVE